MAAIPGVACLDLPPSHARNVTYFIHAQSTNLQWGMPKTMYKNKFEPRSIVTLSPRELRDNGFDLTAISEDQYKRLGESLQRYYEADYSDVLRQAARAVGLQPTLKAGE